MKMAIGGRGGRSHITGIPPAPSNTDSTFDQWEQNDQNVFTWIIQNLEASLINCVLQYPTAKELWDGLATTYGSGGDPLQLFDLHRRAITQRQGQDTLEVFWHNLQTIWMSIDRKQPNPMKYPEDIETFNRIIQEQRLYQFLIGIDEKYEQIRRDILKQDPKPTLEAAYATVRREANRLQILNSTESGGRNSGIGSGLMVKKDKGKLDSWRSDGGGRSDSSTHRSSSREDKSKLVCDHCGKPNHDKDHCFEIIGYPDWWEGIRKTNAGQGARGGKRRANLAIGESTTSGLGGATAGIIGGDAVATAVEIGHGNVAISSGRREEKYEKEEDSGGRGHSYEGDHWAWY